MNDKFFEDVEQEKKRKALRTAMGKCKQCWNWLPFGSDDPDGEGEWGECRHERIDRDGINAESTSLGQLLAGGGQEGCGDFLKMHKDFGCVCFEAKPEKQENGNE